MMNFFSFKWKNLKRLVTENTPLNLGGLCLRKYNTSVTLKDSVRKKNVSFGEYPGKAVLYRHNVKLLKVFTSSSSSRPGDSSCLASGAQPRGPRVSVQAEGHG